MLTDAGGACTKPRIAFFEQLIDKGSTDPIKAFCSDYTEDSDRCPKLLAKLPKIQNVNRNNIKSEILSTIELMSTV